MCSDDEEVPMFVSPTLSEESRNEPADFLLIYYLSVLFCVLRGIWSNLVYLALSSWLIACTRLAG